MIERQRPCRWNEVLLVGRSYRHSTSMVPLCVVHLSNSGGLFHLLQFCFHSSSLFVICFRFLFANVNAALSDLRIFAGGPVSSCSTSPALQSTEPSQHLPCFSSAFAASAFPTSSGAEDLQRTSTRTIPPVHLHGNDILRASPRASGAILHCSRSIHCGSHALMLL